MKKLYRRWDDKWKMAGDLSLLLIPVLHTTIVNGPGISESLRYYLISLIDLLFITFTFFTKTKQNEFRSESRNTEDKQL